MNDELERMWKEAVVTCLRYYPIICLERLRKITFTLRTIADLLADIWRRKFQETKQDCLPVHSDIRMLVTLMKLREKCVIWGSHGGKDADVILGCDTSPYGFTTQKSNIDIFVERTTLSQ
jgi:hypothetical protein